MTADDFIRENFNLFLVGMIGSGKTRLSRILLALTPRAIVFDRKWEYDDGGVFTSFSAAADFILAHPRDDWHLIFRSDRKAEILALIDFVYQMQLSTRPALPPIALFLDEASYYSSSSQMGDVLDKIYTKGRHARISVVTNTQRITQVHPLIRDNSHVWISFRLKGLPRALSDGFSTAERKALTELKPYEVSGPPVQGVHFMTDAGRYDFVSRWVEIQSRKMPVEPSDEIDE